MQAFIPAALIIVVLSIVAMNPSPDKLIAGVTNLIPKFESSNQIKPTVKQEVLATTSANITPKFKAEPEPQPKTINRTPSLVQSKVAVDPDPVISCNFPNSGPKQMRQSECAKATDCGLETGVWEPALSADACKKRQTEYYNSKHPECFVWGKTLRLTPETCTSYKQQEASSNSWNNSLIDCTVTYACTGNTYHYQVDQTICNNFQTSALSVCSSSSNGSSSSYQYTPSTPTIDYQALFRQCVDKADSDYQSYINYLNALGAGSSSAADAALDRKNKALDQCKVLYGS